MPRKGKQIRITKRLSEKLNDVTTPKEEAFSLSKKNIKSKTWKFRIFRMVVCLGLIIYLIFRLTATTNNSFSCTLIPSDNISFKLSDTAYHFTGPLCGCLRDTFPHYGLLFTGNDIVLKRKAEFNRTNFLITSPTPSIPYSSEGFSFNASFKSIIDKNSLKEINIDDILADTSNPIKSHPTFTAETFLSIITDSEIYCRSFGYQNSLVFLPSEQAECDIEINKHNYEHTLSGITLSQKFDAIGKREKVKSSPRVDILGDSVAIIWRGKPSILNYKSKLPFLYHYPDSLSYINILTIKSPYVTRISAFGWNSFIENEWRDIFRSQFAGMGIMAMWDEDLPFIIQTDTGYYVPEIQDKIIPAEIPNFILEDSGIFTMSVNKLLSQEEHSNLYNFFSKKEGTWYKFDSSAFMMVNKLNRVFSDAQAKVVDEYIERISKVGTDAHAMQNLSYQLESYLKDVTVSDTSYRQKALMKRRQFYFRYPPLSKENAISIFNYFEELKFNGATGTVTTDGKTKSVDDNNIIELKELKNCVYTTPALLLGVGTKTSFRLKGEGIVLVDGERVGKTIQETEWFITSMSVIGLLSFVVLMYDIFSRFLEKEKNIS